MAEANKGAREPSRLVGLRTRLLLTFLIPVVLLGVGGFLLLTLPQGETALPRPLSWASPVAIFAALFALGLLLAAALGLQAGDRVSRPIAWLLRAIDAGQVRLLHQRPVQPADWEIDLLARRVQVLLKQNLSGAHAMEELEALRSEMRALLDAAGAGHLDAGAWPRTRATHLLTRRLLDFLRMREESVRDAAEGLARLQGLLEQDWREG